MFVWPSSSLGVGPGLCLGRACAVGPVARAQRPGPGPVRRARGRLLSAMFITAGQACAAEIFHCLAQLILVHWRRRPPQLRCRGGGALFTLGPSDVCDIACD